MRLEGNSPQVQMGKEPEQRTQHYHMKINPTTTTAEKEDDKDSTATPQQNTIAAEKEDVMDSTADKATATNQSTTSTATNENDADSTAKPSVSNSRRGKLTRKKQTRRIQQQPCLG